ncbi:MAG: hypothetical protein CMJ18_27415 [Phycisphaeraceae bacterium]|nr:hypothetical protein [Phycisphaeraceae bacterium]
MSSINLNKTDPRRLARIIQPDRDGPDWSAADLGAILDHQLSSQFETVRDDGPPIERQERRTEEVVTVRDVLTRATPSPADLIELKRFAKHADQCGHLPAEVARALYFAAVQIALQRCGERISSLDDGALQEGVAWMRSQSWISVDLLKAL